MEQVLETVRRFEGVLEVAPWEGSEFPEIAWGDHFFYYSPNGQVPDRVQPYATIVTKDYPGDVQSLLDLPGRWRINIKVARATFLELVGEEPRGEAAPRDLSAADVVLPHPVYRAQSWIAVVNPSERTADLVVTLLREAHENARQRFTRRPQ